MVQIKAHVTSFCPWEATKQAYKQNIVMTYFVFGLVLVVTWKLPIRLVLISSFILIKPHIHYIQFFSLLIKIAMIFQLT